RIIDQNITVRQEQNARLAMFSLDIPACGPELPADLKSHDGLAGAGGHRQQAATLTAEDRLDSPLNGNLLVVPRFSPRLMEERRQESVGGRGGQPLTLLIAKPKFIRGGKTIDLGFPAGEEIVLDDPGAI